MGSLEWCSNRIGCVERIAHDHGSPLVTDWILNTPHLDQIISSVVLVVVLVLSRWLLNSRLRGTPGMSTDMRRRWAAQVRNVALLILVLGMVFIWGAELRTLALSVVAIAAAIVIATKELIMCVSGTILKVSGRSFQIGDRIEIGAIRGDVIDQTLLTTTVLEVGPGTSIHQHSGRTVVLPNSLLLTVPVINETFSDEYVLHAFSVPLSEKLDWRKAEAALLSACQSECNAFLKEAEEHMNRFVRDQRLQSLDVAPRVSVRLDDPERVLLLARIAVPARRKGRIEQSILRRFLEWRQVALVDSAEAEITSGMT